MTPQIKPQEFWVTFNYSRTLFGGMLQHWNSTFMCEDGVKI